MHSILLITDHRSHYRHESVFALGRAIARQSNTDEVWAITRGDERNKDFFDGLPGVVYGVRIDDGFKAGDSTIWDLAASPIDTNRFKTALLRIDRPFDSEIASKLKSSLHGFQHVLNDIDGILRTRLKSFVFELGDSRPKMQICFWPEDVLRAGDQIDDFVLKPDDGYGSKGVVRVKQGQVFSQELICSLEEYVQKICVSPNNPFVVVEFLPGVAKGDNRLLIANGKLISSTLRIPKQGQWIANYVAGSVTVSSQATTHELEILEAVSPVMAKNGVFLYSIDTIEDNSGTRLISEINSLNAGILHIGDGKNQEAEAFVVAQEFLRLIS